LRIYNLISGCLFLLLSCLIVLGSIDLGIGSLKNPNAGLFSLFTGVLLCGLSLLLIMESFTKREKSNQDSAYGWSKDTRWKNLLLTSLALVAYALVLTPLGFMVSTFLLMIFLYRAVEPQGWFASFLFAAVSTFGNWMVFEFWLQCQLPEGLVVPWLKSVF